MGVPGLLRWLRKRFHPSTGKIEGSLDNLYLDLNHLIYLIAGEVNARWLERQTTPDAELPDNIAELIEEDIYIGLIDKIRRLVDHLQPRLLCYIGIDGTAPRAKLNEQRSRRFSDERTQNQPENVIQFDLLKITPGTEFMLELGNRIRAAVDSFRSQEDAVSWQHLDVVFSGADVPGEAELKILEFMRSKPDKTWVKNTSHCFVGMDADLALLALVTHAPRFYTYNIKFLDPKEEMRGKPFESTERLIQSLESELLKCIPKQNYNRDRVIDDFVFLCLFVGNDYVPCLPKLAVTEDGLEALLNVYKTYISRKPYITLGSGRVDWKNCREFFDLLFQCNKSRFDMNTEEKEAQFMREFKTTTPTKDVLNLWCLDYLKTVQWSLTSYYQGTPSWSWSFHQATAPSIPAFMEALKAGVPAPEFDLSKPLPPMLHLLAVLPPENHTLLPEAYRQFAQREDVAQYWPARAVRTGAPHFSEEVVQLLFAQADALESTLSAPEKLRNQVHGNTLWQRLKQPPAAVVVQKPPAGAGAKKGGAPGRGGGSSRGRGR